MFWLSYLLFSKFLVTKLSQMLVGSIKLVRLNTAKQANGNKEK